MRVYAYCKRQKLLEGFGGLVELRVIAFLGKLLRPPTTETTTDFSPNLAISRLMTA